MRELPPDWTEELDPFTPEQVAQIEARIGEALPEPYKEIVMTHGDLYFEHPRLFDVEWQRIDGEPLDPAESRDFVTEYATYGFHSAERVLEQLDLIRMNIGDNLPERYFPFAQDLQAMHLMLDLKRGRGHGAIWAWWFKSEPWGTGDNQYVGYVAESLEAFLFEATRDAPDDW